MSAADTGAHAAVAGGHDPHLQHHFDTPQQQYDSGKLGMWLFLATEVLLFGGLFCAYAVYRANHPEIFDYAHRFLDTRLGAINTVILLVSSLTMAWAVRAAQLGQQRLLAALLGLTLLGGAGFMGIKYVEYRSKWQHGLLWGKHYTSQHDGDGHAAATGHGAATAGAMAAAPAEPEPPASPARQAGTTAPEPGATASATARPVGGGAAVGAEGAAPAATPATGGVMTVTPGGVRVEMTTVPPAGDAPPGTVTDGGSGRAAAAADATPVPGHGGEPKNVQIFFGIYFLMTGLHGLHVLAGMGAIAWILFRALGGAFGPAYFTPVDLTGLYWHLVDLIWIFLFPLLYLIR